MTGPTVTVVCSICEHEITASGDTVRYDLADQYLAHVQEEHQ